jgi:hypothetical protein
MKNNSANRKLAFSVINVINHLIPLIQRADDPASDLAEGMFNYVKASETLQSGVRLLHMQFMPIHVE